jgi:hypothetical protein
VIFKTIDTGTCKKAGGPIEDIEHAGGMFHCLLGLRWLIYLYGLKTITQPEPMRRILDARAREASKEAWHGIFAAGLSPASRINVQATDPHLITRPNQPPTVYTLQRMVSDSEPTNVQATDPHFITLPNRPPTASTLHMVSDSEPTNIQAMDPHFITLPNRPPTVSALHHIGSDAEPSDISLTSLMHGQVQNECRMVADEDIERGVASADDDEEDGYFGLMGDGVGEDDCGGDNDQDDTDDAPDSTGPANKRRTLPYWLKNAFDIKVDESARNSRGPDGLPPLYRDHKTFWFPQPSTFFLLRNSVSPQDLYNPRFFLWDPAALCAGGIPCPNCRVLLRPHGHIPWPRRCVDTNGSFWMIGYRYRCSGCVHPRSGKDTLTFQSWDPRILAMLPQSLACEFPARLSHRSALSTSTLNLMRTCLQNGMGAKQFSDALRVQHIEQYDRLHLQYLNWLAERYGLNNWMGTQYKAFLPYEDRTPDGFAGFAPSAQWLRDVYDGFIEEHRAEFDQHTAMLSAEICAIDHSHKVPFYNCNSYGI